MLDKCTKMWYNYGYNWLYAFRQGKYILHPPLVCSSIHVYTPMVRYIDDMVCLLMRVHTGVNKCIPPWLDVLATMTTHEC